MGTQNDARSAPPRTVALEKIPAAARRMGISPSSVYRELQSGRLAGPLVKTGARASAIPSASVDDWIAARISDAASPQTPQRGRCDGGK